MPLRIVYLRSYDLFDEFLRYELPQGRFAVITRHDFEALATPAAFGSFTREGNRVAGVFASPRGPIVFVDAQQITASFGHTSAAIEPASAPPMQQFTLIHDHPLEAKVTLTLPYRERSGLGVNPYDTEREDVDLFALLVSGLNREQFFRGYTKDW
jgi:hypothetical protein